MCHPAAAQSVTVLKATFVRYTKPVRIDIVASMRDVLPVFMGWQSYTFRAPHCAHVQSRSKHGLKFHGRLTALPNFGRKILPLSIQ